MFSRKTLEVSEDGIYYPNDGKWLDVDQLRLALSLCDISKHQPIKVRNSLTSKGIAESQSKPYEFKPVITHIDSGCKKRVPVEDWMKVLKEYDEIIYPPKK